MLTGLSKLNIGGKVGDAISRMSETLSSAGVIGRSYRPFSPYWIC